MALLVRNPNKGPAVFEHDKDNTFVWEPAGDHGGGDVQQLPDELRENPRFIRAIKAGVLTLEDQDVDLDLDFTAATEAHRRRQADDDAKIMGDVEDLSANDIVLREGACGDCTRNVLIKVVDLGKRPALCEQCPRSAADFEPQVVGEEIQWNQRIDKES